MSPNRLAVHPAPDPHPPALSLTQPSFIPSLQKKKAPPPPKKASSSAPLPPNTLPATPAPLPLDAQLAVKLRDAQRRAGEASGDAVTAAAEAAADEVAFEARLAALRVEAATAAAAKRAADVENVLLGETPDYKNPPPLSATLAKAAGGDAAAAGPGGGGTGLAAGAAAVVLAAIFALTSADFSGGEGGRSSLTKAPPNFLAGADEFLGPEARADLEAKAVALEARLAESPADVEALRSSASIAARLGRDPAGIAALLGRLVEAAPADADGWRQLGAARLAGGDVKGAIAALERARAEAPPPTASNFDAAGDAAAVVALAAARSLSGSPDAAVSELKAALATAGPADGEPALRLGLALGKTLAEWPGHGPEAVEAYARMAEEAPKDFRPPLAKGVLLRSLGRPAEARRALLQARYLAPPEERAVVTAIIGDSDGAPGLATRE